MLSRRGLLQTVTRLDWPVDRYMFYESRSQRCSGPTDAAQAALVEAPGPRCRLRATSPGTPVLAVIGPRPSGCPFPTCGCILSLSLAGPGSLRLPPHCDWPLHDRGRYKPVQCSTMGRPRNFDPVTYHRYSHPLSQPLPFLFDPPSRFFLHPTLSSSSSPPSITTFFPPLPPPPPPLLLSVYF